MWKKSHFFYFVFEVQIYFECNHFRYNSDQFVRFNCQRAWPHTLTFSHSFCTSFKYSDCFSDPYPQPRSFGNINWLPFCLSTTWLSTHPPANYPPTSYVFTFVLWQHFPCPHLIATYNILSAQFCRFLLSLPTPFRGLTSPPPKYTHTHTHSAGQKTTDKLTVAGQFQVQFACLVIYFMPTLTCQTIQSGFASAQTQKTKGSTQR